ncbi:hypothetical protein [Pseudonocardia sp. N23]|uniref:hypothetical protein n=1 Tax=Pseudonocardia sp. N23 TaxID=1987376 RepID=UPI000C02ECBF|nr:hypothetical protein [Pseudonocardia sp. N23]GAY07395.1 hypothetical protein TOK_2620 [Pseudonocardia sp. N23]
MTAAVAGIPGTGVVPPVVAQLCDDAAVFPPGLAPLPDAVRAHRERHEHWWADLAGPLVLADAALPDLASLPAPGGVPLRLAVTVPRGPAGIPDVLSACARLPVRPTAVEVAVPAGTGAAQFLDALAAALAGLGPPHVPEIYVEVPRDSRRDALLDGLTGRYRAKFRTGGVRADLYPDDAELAAAIADAVGAGVAFKATAGLHHAVRNTDPHTGFEQHGFLNLLLATEALVAGGTEQDARVLLAERDPADVAARVAALDDDRVRAVRATFTSFGTCSMVEPLTELIELGVVVTDTAGGDPS